LTVCAVNLFFDAQDMPPPPSNTILVVTIGIKRKILRCILKGWKAYLDEEHRQHAQVTTTLQRCLRQGTEFGRLVVEIVHLAFHVWSRLAKFKKAVRNFENPPKFGKPQLPEWDAYVLLFTRRKVRKRKAEKVGRLAMMRRYQRAWRGVISRRKQLEDAVERSRARLLEAAVVQALREWNAHCRSRGRTVRRAAVYFAAWATWAPRKKRLKGQKKAGARRGRLHLFGARRGLVQRRAEINPPTRRPCRERPSTGAAARPSGRGCGACTPRACCTPTSSRGAWP